MGWWGIQASGRKRSWWLAIVGLARVVAGGGVGARFVAGDEPALVGTQPDDDLVPGSTLTDHRGGEWAVTRSSAPAADIVASLQARIS